MTRGRLDDADRWWTESFAIEEEIGNRPSMMKSLALGSYIAENRGQSRRALDLAIRGVLLTDDITRRDNLAMVAQLVQVARQVGIGMLETSWERITGDPLPPGIRELMD